MKLRTKLIYENVSSKGNSHQNANETKTKHRSIKCILEFGNANSGKYCMKISNFDNNNNKLLMKSMHKLNYIRKMH